MGFDPWVACPGSSIMTRSDIILLRCSMLELLDTGRMAHKVGKWRGAVAIAYAFGLAIGAILTDKLTDLILTFGKAVVITGTSNPLVWIAVGLDVAAMLLMMFGIWQLYRDFEHGDYQEEAERYKREGW